MRVRVRQAVIAATSIAVVVLFAINGNRWM